MSADQPLTGDELATIKAHGGGLVGAQTALRLVAEIERLRALMSHPDAVAVAFASGLTLADLDEVGGMPK